MIRRAVLLGLAALPAGARLAAAHAMLERAEPSVGATVAAAPQELRLHFSAVLEPGANRAEVLDGAGRNAGAGPVRLDPQDRHRLLLPLQPGLAPGQYRVMWWVTSTDGHPTRGSFSFRVAPPP